MNAWRTPAGEIAAMFVVAFVIIARRLVTAPS